MANPIQVIKSSANLTCDGCGKVPEICAVRFKVAPGVEVVVCAKPRSGSYGRGHYEYDPRILCLRRAHARANVCAGCGYAYSEHYPERAYGAVCSDCRSALERVTTVAGDEPGVYALDWSLIGSHYPETVRVRKIPGLAEPPETYSRRVLDLVARVAAASGPRRIGRDVEAGRDFVQTTVLASQRGQSAHTGHVRVELDDGQREAVETLGEAIRQLVDAMYAQGRRDGRDLLGGIARGEYSIGDFTECIEKWESEEENA
jgi:hypothetical protein